MTTLHIALPAPVLNFLHCQFIFRGDMFPLIALSREQALKPTQTRLPHMTHDHDSSGFLFDHTSLPPLTTLTTLSSHLELASWLGSEPCLPACQLDAGSLTTARTSFGLL